VRWFKHFSDSLDDPFIQDLLDKFGAKGYLAYFGLITIIAQQSKKELTGKLKVKPQYMVRKLRLRAATLAQVYHYCDTMGKLTFTNTPKEWNFEFTKVLELQDNYHRHLQATSKELASDEQPRREEKRRDKEKTLKQPNVDARSSTDSRETEDQILELMKARNDGLISHDEFQKGMEAFKPT